MKNISAALVKDQKARDCASESALLKQLKNSMFPAKRVNASSASPMPERFLEKVVFGAADCWVWTGCVDDIGYGRFPYQGENKAHRVAHILFKSQIPKGMLVLHTCDNRQCVNPDHLFLGTQHDNMQDMVAKGRCNPPRKFGSSNPRAKLTEKQVEEIRSMVANGSKQIEASRMFSVSPMTVSRIIRRELWS